MEQGRAKKIINTVHSAVRDNLTGYIAVNTGLCLLKNHNVVFRHDLEELKSSRKVTLVSGGGSGHEPFSAGFIGKGMLTAGVAGEIFTSPSPAVIMAALQLLGKGNKAGILVIVMNYTGDRLNFGLAMERSKNLGCDIRMITVAEDCALQSIDKTAGRRGLSGGTFVFKVAGALAEEGKSLDEIYETIQKVLHNLGTIGVSLSPCNIPGSGSTFTLPHDENELGLGVHGEPGIRRMKHCPASELVKVMIDTMTDEKSVSHLSLQKGERIALIINNLGGTSLLEMNIVSKEAIQYFESQGIVVERAYCASVMTSLEMAGVLFTVLKLEDNMLSYIDAPTSAPAWPISYLSTSGKPGSPSIISLEGISSTEKLLPKSFGPSLLPSEQKIFDQCLRSVCHSLVSAEDELNRLDRNGGDGDCGTTLKRGAQAILVYLEGNPSLEHPKQVAMQLSSIVEASMGGTSGPLYSLFLNGAGDTFQKDCSFGTWGRAIFEGMITMQKFAGAQPGDRTMIDPLNAFCLALSESSKTGKSHQEQVATFIQAQEAAEKSALATTGMKAQAGRASYVDPARLTTPDPGAQGVAIWLKAIKQVLSPN